MSPSSTQLVLKAMGCIVGRLAHFAIERMLILTWALGKFAATPAVTPYTAALSTHFLFYIFFNIYKYL